MLTRSITHWLNFSNTIFIPNPLQINRVGKMQSHSTRLQALSENLSLVLVAKKERNVPLRSFSSMCQFPDLVRWKIVETHEPVISEHTDFAVKNQRVVIYTHAVRHNPRTLMGNVAILFDCICLILPVLVQNANADRNHLPVPRMQTNHIGFYRFHTFTSCIV